MSRNLFGNRFHSFQLSALPGESVFSIASRFHVLAGSSSFHTTLEYLFGSRGVRPASSTPSGLNNLARTLFGSACNAQQVALQHTPLPLWLACAPQRIQGQVLNQLAGGSALGLKTILGIVAGRLGANDSLRYCPSCAEEEWNTTGYAIWHVVHQLPGVLVCPRHGTVLLQHPRLAAQEVRQLFLPAQQLEDFVPSLSISAPDANRLLRSLAIELEAILSEGLSANRNWGALSLLSSHGFATAQSVRRVELNGGLRTLLRPLAGIDPFRAVVAGLELEFNWACQIAHGTSQQVSPLKLAVFRVWLRSLGVPPEVSESEPRDIRRRLVRDAEILESVSRAWPTYLSARKVAMALGMSTNSVLIAAARLGIPIVRRPSRISEEKALEVHDLLRLGQDQHTVAQTTGLSLSSVNRLLRSNPRLELEAHARKMGTETQLRREEWHALKARNQALGKKQLRTICPKLYAWLYRNDRAWLLDQ